MKVCYIFREKERKAHSIELLFDTISEEVGKKEGVEVVKWYKPLSNFKAIWEVRKLKADIYHITGDCYYLSLFLPWHKTIMTIHDIGMYKNFPKTLKARIFVFLRFILPLKLLKVSTAISELTKSDLVDKLKVDGDKIKIIPNPLVLPISFKPKEFNKFRPVILQIGTGSHKNLIGLIEAVKGIECFLEIVGKPSKDLVNLMNTYKINFRISSYISTEEVICKYEQSDMVYFASLSEGFGLPILEAQAIGRPVITSNIEPTNWVCGDGGLLVDPYSIEDIKKAILRIISDTTFRNTLIEKGKNNVNRFALNSIIDKYISLYQELGS